MEICKIAGYSRTTFYEYFDDIYDLLNEYEDIVIDEFMLEMEPYIIFEKKLDELEIMIKEGFPHAYLKCSDNMDLFLAKEGDSMFSSKLCERLKMRFNEALGRQGSGYMYLLEYTFYALISLLHIWNSQGRPIEIDKLMIPVLDGVRSGQKIVMESK
ncbi:MAG: TetR/AcrR family transcriptional regulator [Lachnospiraceae bacterium]|nr:TetR/AcrR family transcriptional regulator [Lachnospiraceae bacterium]